MRIKAWARVLFTVLATATALTGTANGADLPGLRVSTNGRFLITAEGRPFFWLGDDAAELCHRLDRQEAERYLQKRAEQRFTLIQTRAVAETDLRSPNAAGDLPFVGLDTARPNEPYWQHVDWIIARANAVGLYVGLNPGSRLVIGPERARAYGVFLGQRYKNVGLVWIVGYSHRGDSATDPVVKAMVEGLRAGDGSAHLVAYSDRSPSDAHSRRFSDDDGLYDVYAFHTFCNPLPFVPRVTERITREYARVPPKPILEVGPYEDQPICYLPNDQDYSNAYDVRWWLYHGLFGGAFGHTYGNHGVWQMHDPKRGAGFEGPIRTWAEALDSPGASQFRHARALLESRPFLRRIPDNTVVVPAENRGEVPGVGAKLIVATRSSDGAYAMVYVPASRRFSVDLETLSGAEVQAWWFNPRTGAATDAGRFPREGTLAFTPPDAGETVDWVLVLDDTARRFPPPGTARAPRPPANR